MLSLSFLGGVIITEVSPLCFVTRTLQTLLKFKTLNTHKSNIAGLSFAEFSAVLRVISARLSWTFHSHDSLF